MSTTKQSPEQGGGLLSLAGSAQASDQFGAAGAPAKRRISSQTLVLVAVLGGAGALLFGMRQMGMGPRVSLADLKIEYERADDGAGDAARTTRVLKDLEEAAKPAQVKAEALGRNPFRLGQAAEPSEELDDSSFAEKAQADAQAKAEEAERKRLAAANSALESALASLQLYSVMGGRVPLARINDQTVTIGDTVADRFTVKNIEGRAVILEAEGKEFTLSVEEQREPSGRAKAKSSIRKK